ELVAGSGAGIVINNVASGDITLGGATLAERNTVTASGSANGISVTGLTSAASSVVIRGNDLTSDAVGLYVSQAPGNVTIQGNSFQGTTSTVGLKIQDLGSIAGKTVLIGGTAAG